MRAPLHIAADPGALIRPSRPAKWVAAQIGEDISTVYKLLRAGLLQGYKGGAGGGSVMVFLDSVAAYQAARALPQPGAPPSQAPSQAASKGRARPSPAAHGSAVQGLRALGLRV